MACLLDIVRDLVAGGLPVRPAAAALLRELGSSTLTMFLLQPGDWARPVDDRDVWIQPLPWIDSTATPSRLVALRLWPLWAELAESVEDLEAGPSARLALLEADAGAVVQKVAACLAQQLDTAGAGPVRFRAAALPNPDQLAAEYRALRAAPATCRSPVKALAEKYDVNRPTIQRHLSMDGNGRVPTAAPQAPRVRQSWHPLFSGATD